MGCFRSGVYLNPTILEGDRNASGKMRRPGSGLQVLFLDHGDYAPLKATIWSAQFPELVWVAVTLKVPVMKTVWSTAHRPLAVSRSVYGGAAWQPKSPAPKP